MRVRVNPGGPMIGATTKATRHIPKTKASKPAGSAKPVKATRHSAKRTSGRRTLTLNGQGVTTMEDDVKFGRNKPYSPDEAPRLVLDKYMAGVTLPKAHAVVDRASLVTEWPMYLNDQIGDCTCAAVGHVLQAWTRYANTEVTVTDEDVLTAYEAVSGYDPVTGANDNGANEQDVLNYWRKTGVGGHRIAGFAQLEDLSNLTMAKQCLDIFGTVYLGIEVPDSAMQQFQAGQPWDVAPGAQIVGGHAVPIQYWGTHEYGEIEVVTWGQRQKMTRAFWDAYVEEAWVVFSTDWLNKVGKTIEGFNVAQLAADFEALTGEPLS